jgi:predicted double-glycine peptidase
MAATITQCLLLLQVVISTDRGAVKVQSYDSCAQCSLYAWCRLLNVNVNFSQVEMELGPADQSGRHTVEQLNLAAIRLGLRPRSVYVPKKSISKLPTPFIAHTRRGLFRRRDAPHFFVVLRIDDEYVTCLDPPFAHQQIARSVFDSVWTGFAVTSDRLSAIDSTDNVTNVVGNDSWNGITVSYWISTVFLLAFTLMSYPYRFTYRSCSRIIRFLKDTFNQKRSIWIFTATIAIAALLTTCFIATLDFGPQLEIVDDYHFGTLVRGEHYRELIVQNTGRSPLRISNVASHCGCVVVNAPQTILAHGFGQLKCKISVADGRQSARIVIRSNAKPFVHSTTMWWTGAVKPKVYPSVA